MKPKRFTEKQIIGVLKEAEAGAKTADLARRHGVSEATMHPVTMIIASLVTCSATHLPTPLKQVNIKKHRNDVARLPHPQRTFEARPLLRPLGESAFPRQSRHQIEKRDTRSRLRG